MPTPCKRSTPPDAIRGHLAHVSSPTFHRVNTKHGRPLQLSYYFLFSRQPLIYLGSGCWLPNSMDPTDKSNLHTMYLVLLTVYLLPGLERYMYQISFPARYLAVATKDKCHNCNMWSFAVIMIVHCTAMQCWSEPKGAETVDRRHKLKRKTLKSRTYWSRFGRELLQSLFSSALQS